MNVATAVAPQLSGIRYGSVTTALRHAVRGRQGRTGARVSFVRRPAAVFFFYNARDACLALLIRKESLIRLHKGLLDRRLHV